MINQQNSILLWQLVEDLTEEEKADTFYCAIKTSLNNKEVEKIINNIQKRIAEAKRIKGE